MAKKREGRRWRGSEERRRDNCVNPAMEEKTKNIRGDWKETCPQGALFVLAAELKHSEDNRKTSVISSDFALTVSLFPVVRPSTLWVKCHDLTFISSDVGIDDITGKSNHIFTSKHEC